MLVYAFMDEQQAHNFFQKNCNRCTRNCRMKGKENQVIAKTSLKLKLYYVQRIGYIKKIDDCIYILNRFANCFKY